MRRELQDLFNARMAELMKSQIEATKMTAEAAKNLAKIHQNQPQPKKRGVRSSSSSGHVRGVSGGATPGGLHHGGVPEDLKTMISKTESSVPEILSVVEATGAKYLFVFLLVPSKREKNIVVLLNLYIL